MIVIEKDLIMTISFWLITGIVLAICGYIFTKTVSNDAENDFRLRDIMSNSEETLPLKEEKSEEIPNFPGKNLTQRGFMFKDEINSQEQTPVVNFAKKETYNSYSTKIHDDNSETVNNTSSVKNNHSQEKSYYQKDRCMITDKVENEQQKQIVMPKSITITDTKIEQEEKEEEKIYTNSYAMKMQKEYTPTINKFGILHYIKTFWKGATFALGLPAFTYGLFSFIFNAPTTTEKLTYSIWILLGVILIK